MADTPNILATIRMYREVRGWPFEKARDFAVQMFLLRGWPIPTGLIPAAQTPLMGAEQPAKEQP